MSKLEKQIADVQALQEKYATCQTTWAMLNELVARLKKMRPAPKTKKPTT